MPRRSLALTVRSCLIAAALAPIAAAGEGAWELPDAALGVRVAPILLLSRGDVQRELGIDPTTAAAVADAIVDFYGRAAALRGRSGPEAVAARRALDESVGRWVAEHLTAEQRGRLDQLDLQWEGAAALITRPTVAESLGLSTEQRGQIAEALGALPPSAGDHESRLAAHLAAHRAAVALLTDEQRTRWEAILGPVFEPILPPAPEATAAR